MSAATLRERIEALIESARATPMQAVTIQALWEALLEAESAPTPLGWQACPVCGGRGTVPFDFYGRVESSSAAPFPITCRTCDGRTVLPVGAGGRAEPPARAARREP